MVGSWSARPHAPHPHEVTPSGGVCRAHRRRRSGRRRARAPTEQSVRGYEVRRTAGTSDDRCDAGPGTGSSCPGDVEPDAARDSPEAGSPHVPAWRCGAGLIAD